MKNELFTADSQPKIPVLKTGMPALDVIIGGGFPQGKIAEVYGLHGTGKTTLCMQFVAGAQAQGKRAVWVDLENAWDVEYARSVGVDLKKLLMMKPSFGEEALEDIIEIVESGETDIIVVDSIPAMAPRAELEAPVGSHQMGSQARLLAQAFRKLIPALQKSKTVLIFINQLRANLMGGQYNMYTRPGGYALKYYERTAIELKNGMGLKVGDEMIGKEIIAKAVKSYSISPFKQATLTLVFGEGFSVEADTIETGLELGILAKKGNTIWFGEEKLGVGKKRAREFLKENPSIANDIQTAINS